MLLRRLADLLPVELSRRRLAAAGLDFEDAWFQAADGTRLHGWYVPPRTPTPPSSSCHGNGGNITHRAGSCTCCTIAWGVGADLRLPRLRPQRGATQRSGGAGRRPGRRTWLAAREGRREGDLVLMGESLGGAVAVELAAARRRQGDGVGEHVQLAARRGGLSFSLAAGPLVDADAFRFGRARSPPITARCCRATAGRTRSSPSRWAGGCSTPPTSPRSSSRFRIATTTISGRRTTTMRWRSFWLG